MEAPNDRRAAAAAGLIPTAADAEVAQTLLSEHGEIGAAGRAHISPAAILRIAARQRVRYGSLLAVRMAGGLLREVPADAAGEPLE